MTGPSPLSLTRYGVIVSSTWCTLRDTTESAYRAEDSLVRAIDGRVTLDGLGAYRLEGIEAEKATA
jgi:hypothetical protein